MLLAGAGLPAFALISMRPRAETSEELLAVVGKYTGGKPAQSGRVKFDIATIVENGNSVSVTVAVDSPMTATDFVKSIAIFNEKNPQRDVIVAKLGPRAGRARMSTRIRLATSQHLIAIAELSDGSYWSQGVDVIVALAACIE